jgi:DNA-binding sugar fermentation-stimulating protein
VIERLIEVVILYDFFNTQTIQQTLHNKRKIQYENELHNNSKIQYEHESSTGQAVLVLACVGIKAYSQIIKQLLQSGSIAVLSTKMITD